MKRIMLILCSVLVVFLTLNLQFSAAFAQTTTFNTLTITNPTPASGDYFGYSLAAVGTDQMLIGAYGDNTGSPDAGAAYLFNTKGVLLNTFTNPTPAGGDQFGYSLTAVGADRVLIGAPNDSTTLSYAGAAYLFSTNGALLNTFTNPTPASGEDFGYSVAAMGTDRVLIGAPYDDTGASDAGVAYLLSTNGTLLTIFTNPAPAENDYFGTSVAAVGTDRVLIGSPSYGPFTGSAYLFNTDGARLATFTNPNFTQVGGDLFGCSVAAVGTHRVLIGAYADDTGASSAGAAYLFSFNGELLTAFTNPTPAAFEFFGVSVAVTENDRVVIGAYGDNPGAGFQGAAYLLSTNGAVLNTFTSPVPVISDEFGHSVAAVGTDHMLIGAYTDSKGAHAAGAAYLFSTLPMSDAPILTIRLTATNTIAVSWPSPSSEFNLQQNTNGIGTLNWSNIVNGIQDNGTVKYFIANLPMGNRFFRLFRP